MLIMEVLPGILEDGLERRAFFAHPKGKSLKITHLSFVDGVLLFFKGNKESVENIKAIINQFSENTGLNISARKSLLVTAGINHVEAKKFIDILGYELATIPFSYLGIMLISGRLNASSCIPLVEKITCRIANWKNNFLSYAYRLELIKTVISSFLV